MNSPWLMLIYSLADRLGEYDPRKIASLPAEILLYWQAWFSLTGNAVTIPSDSPPVPPAVSRVSPAVDQQCADVVRILGQ